MTARKIPFSREEFFQVAILKDVSRLLLHNFAYGYHMEFLPRKSTEYELLQPWVLGVKFRGI